MRPRYEYYADFIECNGHPQGVKKISNRTVKHRYVSYKFIYKRKKIFDSERGLRKVVRINSYGVPTVWLGNMASMIEGEMKNTFPIIEICDTGINFYDDYGYVDYVQTYYNSSNIMQKEFQRLALYENNGNDIYLIINWEDWDISQPLNYYLESLLLFTQFKTTTVLIYDIFNKRFE